MAARKVILPDVLQPALTLVFCGTAVSRISHKRGYPYANPGNRFWPTLRELKVVPATFDPSEFPRLIEFGIGYTDLNKTQVGIDSDLSPDHFDVIRLRRNIRRHKPALLAFTSKNAASVFFGTRQIDFGRQPQPFEDVEIHVLPSPSGLAKSHWDIAPWRALARRYHAMRTG